MNSLQQVCSTACALQLARARREKKERKHWQERKRALKTNRELIKEAQALFNKFIRLRDKGRPCISCGRNPNDANLITGSRWDCGHYRSVGSCPELRFEELNAHKQCVSCNQHKSGNAVEYRLNLIARIGLDKVEWLEGKHIAKHYSRDDLLELKEVYRMKIKALNEKHH